ncbi:MAG TPA: vWA domain-containing protein, partial [Opitutaceae bacterium]|nr:vWA domain-containing protein [Opitutaceae bacterium]
MSFASPAWLLLLPLLGLAGWRWPALRVQEPLRAIVLLALTLALAGLRIGGVAGRDVWVLVDRSASAATAWDRAGAEWESLLAQGRGRDDRLHFVDFAAEPIVRERGDPVFRGARTSTRLAGAVRHTLAQLEPGRPARLLVFGDGYSTEPLRGLDEALRARGTPLDYRLLPVDPRPDARIVDLRVAPRAEPGSAVLLELELAGPEGARVPWELRRDGKAAGRGEAAIARGRAVVRLTDRAPAAGAVRYEALVTAAEDAIPDNNRGEAWLAVAGAREVILATAYADDPLVGVLAGAGWTVRQVTKPGELAPGMLAGARLLILNNVMAAQCPAEFLRAADFWVREQGGALLMAGGKGSFGAGGWFQSPLDELLPVSMELRTEHRRLATALAIALDRSGSMAAGVPGGGAKIDLANAGAARAAELLGDDDLLAVYAVDSEPHLVAPLAEVGPNRKTIDEVVRAITSGGGGIYVYQALNAAWEDLRKVRGARRHVILFADAADAEEPGEYVKLLAEMREMRVTVTVIGLGTEDDCDAAFLKDVAERGGGRIYFCADASELPAVFAQETVAVARAMFVDEATPLKPTPGWLEL